jgi:hypothetical protein
MNRSSVAVRTLSGVLTGLVCGTAGFCLGMKGPEALPLFPFVFIVMAITAAPSAALLSLILAGAMEDLAAAAVSRASLRWSAVLIGMPLGVLNLLPALFFFNRWLPVGTHLGFNDYPIAYLLGGVAGGAGLGYGVAHGLRPGGRP